MTGQLNNSLLSNNSAELQEEIDCLDTRVTQAECNISTNTTDINTVADDLSSYKKTMADTVDAVNVKATSINADAVKSTQANITSATIDNATITTINNTTLKGNVVTAQSISAPNISGTTISATNVKATTVNADEIKSTGDVVGATGTFTTVDTTNVIAGTVKADSISGAVTGNVTSSKATITNANIDNLTVDTEANIQAATIENADITTVDAKSITADTLTATTANQTTTTIDNLTVNNTLCLGDNVSIAAKFADATADSLTTDKLIVNGDSTLNGAVTAGSLTIGDGAVTASEYCIGAKGTVIDKDLNITANNITAESITADSINVADGTTTLDQLCVTTTTECNAIVKNLYPTNITIDKDVGCLHYTCQLDTDNTGNVLADYKNVYPKDIKCSCYYLQSYCDREGYCKTNSGYLDQFKRLGGICLDTWSCRNCVCSAAKYSNDIILYTCINDTYSELDPGCSPQSRYTRGFNIHTFSGVTSSTEDEFHITGFDTNCTSQFLALYYCPGCKCNITVWAPTEFKCSATFDNTIQLKCIPYCGTSSNVCALSLDSCNNVVSYGIAADILGSACKCCTSGCYTCSTCLYQCPSFQCQRYNKDYSNSNMYCCLDTIACIGTDTCCYYYQCYCCSYDSNSRSIRTCTYQQFCIDNTRRIECYFEQCICDSSKYRCTCNSVCNCTDYNNAAYHCVMTLECDNCYCGDTSNSCIRYSYLYDCLNIFNETSRMARYVCVYCNGKYYNCPDWSWELNIKNQNLCLTNPFDNTDIFRVEDGKIYTKCGEFTSGGGIDYDIALSDCYKAVQSHDDTSVSTCVTYNNDCYYNYIIDKNDPTYFHCNVYAFVDYCCDNCVTLWRCQHIIDFLNNPKCDVYICKKSSGNIDYYCEKTICNDMDCCFTAIACYSIDCECNYKNTYYCYCYNARDPHYNCFCYCYYTDCYCYQAYDTKLYSENNILCGCVIYCECAVICNDQVCYCKLSICHKNSGLWDYCIDNYCECLEEHDYCCVGRISGTSCRKCQINAYGTACLYSCLYEYDSGVYYCDYKVCGTDNFYYDVCFPTCAGSCHAGQVIENTVTYCYTVEDKLCAACNATIHSVCVYDITNSCAVQVDVAESYHTIDITCIPAAGFIPIAGRTDSGISFAFICKGTDAVKFYDSNMQDVTPDSVASITYAVKSIM